MSRIFIRDIRLARGKARLLRQALLGAGLEASLTRCQDVVAAVYGYDRWAEMKAACGDIGRPSTELATLDSEQVTAVLKNALSIAPALACQMAAAVRFDDIRHPAVVSLSDAVTQMTRGYPRLEDLGISRLDEFRRAFRRFSGLVLICGSNGSGRQTTLAVVYQELRRLGRRIGDPGQSNEFPHPEGSEKKNFGEALKEALRAQPEVMLFGEIRDPVMLQQALDSAEAGQLVVVTMDAPSILTAISRLGEMGAQPDELRRVLRGVLAQGLAHCHCTHCKDCRAGREVGGGSGICEGSAYGGKIIVSECVSFRYSEDVEDAILLASGTPHGMKPHWKAMVDDGLDKALAGLTSIEEIRRVCGPITDQRIVERGIMGDLPDVPGHVL